MSGPRSHAGPTARLRALVYGDVDMNLIDGSAIWLASTAELFARAGCDVTVVLKSPIRTDRLLGPTTDLAIALVEPSLRKGPFDRTTGRPLDPERAVETLVRLDRAQAFDLIVVRGSRVARAAAATQLAGRLWTYLTDFPQSAVDLDSAASRDLRRTIEGSRIVLCQTEELRTFLELAVGAAVGRTMLLPPVIPDAPAPTERTPVAGRTLRIVYTGKFAPDWSTLEMTALPARLAERGVDASLTAIGDKIHDDPRDPSYRGRMEAALRDSVGVEWIGGRSRAEALAEAGRADIGWSWRSRVLDASLELSTKVLEYGALELPVVLNRTPAHERLLGVDYPLFAADLDDVVDVIEAATRDPVMLTTAADRVHGVAEEHTMSRAVTRLRTDLERAFPLPLTGGPSGRPLRVGVASHDLKFFSRIVDHFRTLPNVQVRLDEWPSLHRQNVDVSRRLPRVGRRGRVRVVRAERGLVQPARSARPAPHRPAASVRADRPLAGRRGHRPGRPRRVREPVVRGDDPIAHRLAGRQAFGHFELRRRRVARPIEVRRGPVQPWGHRDDAGAEAVRSCSRCPRAAARSRSTIPPRRQVEATLGLPVGLASCFRA